jgi:membrane protein CcdC involved in cytochrome C biogenesis
MFSFLALGDVTRVAFWINMMSVVSSAFTILFMHWTIVMIGRKVLRKPFAELSTSEGAVLLLSGAVGSLIYTFSDTFWFSAVEAEVYAMSSFFTAIVVWAAFKWELVEDEATANRWILFIAYLVGLSIGVHLLNLVTLPALALLWYFKKTEKPTYKGGFIAVLVGLFILGVINSGIIPGLPSVAFWFELQFVNNLGMGYGSGAIFFMLCLLAAVVFGIRYSYQHGKLLLNMALFSFVFLLIGYSTYTVALVRSGYNPPINENDPSNILNFLKYLKREQYGSRSLLYGPVYTAQIEDFKKGEDVYKMKDGKYEVYTNKPEYVYQKDQQMLLPRVWSNSGSHVQMYQEMLGIPAGQKPSFGDNLRFMFTHQLGNMYTRYLLWNFIGRESDLEGAYAISNPFEDESKLPDVMKNNKARNNYYCLPIIMVLLGFYLLYRKNEKDFLVTIMMFVLSGIALAVYLNSPPAEPRERDYIYVGSFYFLAIWAGLGVMQLAEWLTKLVKAPQVRWALLTVFSFSAPVILAQQNWDDHDRSGRYHQIDFAKNLLNSCAPNAILFTGGDNDTFPLWYVQEVEGFRTDVRVCNLSLLGTDWYIDQMKRQTYESAPLPIGLKKDQFLEGVNDQIMYDEKPNIQSMSLPDYLDLLHKESPTIQAQTSMGETIFTFPCDSLTVPVNVAQVTNEQWFPKRYAPITAGILGWKLPSKNIFKGELIQLEIIANNAVNGWKRPIYFASTLPGDQYLGLKESMQLEGYAYRLMPFKIPGALDGFVDSKIMADNMLNKMYWRGLNDDKIYYHGDFYMGIPSVTLRLSTLRLADQFIQEGDKVMAKKVLNHLEKIMPDKVIPYDQFSARMVALYIEVGEYAKALDISKTMIARNDRALNYYLSGDSVRGHDRDIQIAWYEMSIIGSILANSPIPANQYASLLAPIEKWNKQFK